MRVVGAVLLVCAAFDAAAASSNVEPSTTAGGGQDVAVQEERPPTSSQLREALGLAADLLAREREQLKQEQRRLELLREEIRFDLERLADLYAKLDKPLHSAERLRAQQRTARVRHIGKSLTAMSPKAAAVAIERMDDDLAVELLSVVDGKKVGKILESMDAQRAAVLMQKVVGAQEKTGRAEKKGER